MAQVQVPGHIRHVLIDYDQGRNVSTVYINEDRGEHECVADSFDRWICEGCGKVIIGGHVCPNIAAGEDK